MRAPADVAVQYGIGPAIVLRVPQPGTRPAVSAGLALGKRTSPDFVGQRHRVVALRDRIEAGAGALS